MWAIVESGSITKMYTRPRAFKIGSNQYPANTMALWSESELQSIGVYPVTIDNTNLKNKEYYMTTLNKILHFISKCDISLNTINCGYCLKLYDFDKIKEHICKYI